MRKYLLVAGLAAAALIPSLALAQDDCQQQRHDNRVVGTVVGAGLGALLGNAVSEGGGKTGGTIIGGVGGAVVGNQVAGAATNCDRGRANRYGAYDRDGRWMPSVSTAYGYYDVDGRWIAAGGADAAPAYGHDANYSARDMWAGAPGDVRAREDWLDRRIHAAMDRGRLERGQGDHALRDLSDIRHEDSTLRRDDGELSDRDQVYVQGRLDRLSQNLGWDRNDGQQ